MTILLWGCVVAITTLVAMFVTRHSKGREDLVFVNDDGTVRELTPEEVAYVNREFQPGDSGRPYVKARYASRTPDGKLGGFLPRSEVPLTARWTR